MRSKFIRISQNWVDEKITFEGRLENFDCGAASIQTGNFSARLEYQQNKQ